MNNKIIRQTILISIIIILIIYICYKIIKHIHRTKKNYNLSKGFSNVSKGFSDKDSELITKEIFFNANTLPITKLANNDIAGANIFTVENDFTITANTLLMDYFTLNNNDIFLGNKKTITIIDFPYYGGLFICNGDNNDQSPHGDNNEQSPQIKNLTINLKNNVVQGEEVGVQQYNGGFVKYGQSFLKVENCIFIGNVQGNYAGGICGSEAGSGGYCEIINCRTIGDVMGEGAGGICADNAGSGGHCKVLDCHLKGNVTGINAGGICGSEAGGYTFSHCEVTDCTMEGKVTGENAGAICGHGPAMHAGCANEGSQGLDCGQLIVTNCKSTHACTLVNNQTGNGIYTHNKTIIDRNETSMPVHGDCLDLATNPPTTTQSPTTTQQPTTTQAPTTTLPPTTTQQPTIRTRISNEYGEEIVDPLNRNDIIINLDVKPFNSY